MSSAAPSGVSFTDAPTSVHEVLSSPGAPLDARTRAFMEPRFGNDFSDVRVHSDARAVESAEAVQARAFTVGHHLVFGAGENAPGTAAGRALLAHELAHVVQQSSLATDGALGQGTVLLQREPRGPTYGNLPRHLPAPGSSGAVVRLKEVRGTWKEIGPRYTRIARGNYDFVVKEGEIFAVKAKGTMGAIGHTEAARGERVSWAGQVKFEAGQVLGWDDGSGHYRSLSSRRRLAVQAGLPDDDGKFAQHRETAPRPRPKASAPQLPVEQPATRPRTPGEPPKVDAGPPRLEEFERRYGKPAATTPAVPPTAAKPAASPARKPPSTPPIAGPTTEPSATRKSTTPRTQTDPPRQTGGGGQAVSTDAGAAQRTYSALAGRFTSQLSGVVTSKDPEMGAAIADMNRLLDAQAFLRNPRQYSANFFASYMINGAFGKFTRQLAEAEARFFSTYPDVRSFSQQPLVHGMTLNALQGRYEETSRNLRIPDARQALVNVFLTLDLNENSPKEEFDRRIGLINQYLSRQPQIGTYVKEFDEAKVNYAFGLVMVSAKIDNLQQQLGELPGDFADNIRRRGDALFSAEKILKEFYDQVLLLNALPGASAMLYMLLQLSEGFAGLGRGLHQFAYRAGGRQAEYKQEIARLETVADRLSKVRGAFDVIYPKPGR
jgi:hypothetical protein